MKRSVLLIPLAVLVVNMIYWQVLSLSFAAALRPEGITRGDGAIIGAMYTIAVFMYMVAALSFVTQHRIAE